MSQKSTGQQNASGMTNHHRGSSMAPSTPEQYTAAYTSGTMKQGRHIHRLYEPR